jgi:uncharacterized protein
MKVALLSDSHDNMDALYKAVEYCNKLKIDHVLHAGDLVAPFVSRALNKLNAPLTIVYGNNDGERHGLYQMFKGKIFDPPFALTLDGRRVLMLHAPILLDVLKDSDKYDLVLYGHTHEIENSKGKNLVVNPGELCGWLTAKNTIALWDTKENAAEIVEL